MDGGLLSFNILAFSNNDYTLFEEFFFDKNPLKKLLITKIVISPFVILLNKITSLKTYFSILKT